MIKAFESHKDVMNEADLPRFAELLSQKRQQMKKNGRHMYYSLEQVQMHDKPDDLWIIVHGGVFNLTKWARFHPGGAMVIENVAGCDATQAMLQYHPSYVFNWLPNFYIGDLKEDKFYKTDDCDDTLTTETSYKERYDKLEQAFQKLSQEVIQEGFYHHKISYTVMKTCICLMILATSICFLRLGWVYKSLQLQLISGLIMGVFYQQIAFLGHDAGHSGVSGYRWIDSLYGIIIGNVLTGLSTGWWKNTHNIHHTLPNVVNYDPDVQHMPFFAIDWRFFKSLRSEYHKRLMHFNGLTRLMTKYQHYYFYPLMLAGRPNLMVQSYLFVLFHPQASLWYIEIPSLMLYWLGLTRLLSCYCLTFYTALAVFAASMATASILHVQIVVSHFSSEFMDTIPYKNKRMHWLELQLNTTMDIDCASYMRWFHGGLQHQVAHHLFPRVPRHNLTRLRKKIEKFCEQNGLVYDSATFYESNVRMVKQLKKCSEIAGRTKAPPSLFSTVAWDALCCKG